MLYVITWSISRKRLPSVSATLCSSLNSHVHDCCPDTIRTPHFYAESSFNMRFNWSESHKSDYCDKAVSVRRAPQRQQGRWAAQSGGLLTSQHTMIWSLSPLLPPQIVLKFHSTPSFFFELAIQILLAFLLWIGFTRLRHTANERAAATLPTNQVNTTRLATSNNAPRKVGNNVSTLSVCKVASLT